MKQEPGASRPCRCWMLLCPHGGHLLTSQGSQRILEQQDAVSLPTSMSWSQILAF